MVPDRDGYPLSCRLLYHTDSASVFLHGCNTGWFNQEFNEHGRQQIAQRLIRAELGDGVSPSLSVDSASVAALGPLGLFGLRFVISDLSVLQLIQSLFSTINAVAPWETGLGKVGPILGSYFSSPASG